ncbi:L,D-transpeptidase [Agriterribacter sp.]|uniref:L,D-transpeptidase family protein n=1 Tax=Agriterribacter sp. TaxID=2821509 RepID=UPI002B9952E8|nr:L,D-transpeptidase [Agriterribacter sp.]HRP55972.1 L,D-transpeptidase [Agriterribacter sp.]
MCFGFQGIKNNRSALAGLPSAVPDTSSIKDKKRTPDRPVSSAYRLVIKKSAYEMTLFDEEGWYGTYPVVFGNKNQGDKRMEGDRLTPEGHFRIVGKKIHGKWGKFLMLDYPTKESYEKFKMRKASGAIPKKASIGGGIGIHGTRPNEEWVIDKYINWTEGCISVRYSDMDELYDMLPIGTEVIIEK